MTAPSLLARCAALAALVAAGCGPSPQRLPDRVNIALIDATVAPATDHGKSWDGPGTVPIEVLSRMSQILAAAPARGRVEVAAKTGAVVAELASAVAAGVAPPDPRGTVDLLVAGSSRRLTLSERQDTFRPTWSGVTFDQVPLVEDLRLRVQLFDADSVGSDDPIGTAELVYEDLVAALSAEQVTQIRVAEQTHNQLLYIGISVTAR